MSSVFFGFMTARGLTIGGGATWPRAVTATRSQHFASGVTWMVLTYFVPIVVVSCVLLIWQLYARRGEALDPALGRTPRPHAAAALRSS